MRAVLVGAALLAMTGAAFAAPPSEGQKAEFYAACTKQGAAELCSCKADAAMKIVDSEFMDVIIASIKGKPLAAEYYNTYNDYIVASTQACGMGM
jgi:hypothetical protein